VTGPLGLSLADLSPETRDRFGIKADVAAGVVVVAVKEGSPAQDKRLQAGDVIVEVAQEAVSTPQDVEDRLAALKKDGRTNVQLVVQNKDGHVRWVNLPLAE
jgi:serine protease Do